MRSIERLDHGWVFHRGEVDAAAAWSRLADGETVTLPHSWNALDGQDGGNDYFRGRCTYAKTLARPVGDEVWLEIAGANSSADVYVNGQHLGHHDGGYSTFRVDLTPALQDDNVLVVAVDNSPHAQVYPQRADFTFYGGLYRDVTVISVPAAHFDLTDGGPGFTATPTLADKTARVEFSAAVTGGETVRFDIDGVGQVDAPVVDGHARGELTIDDPHLWHGLRDPFLYTARATLLSAGDQTDTIELRFGCRTFEVDPDRGFVLNGEPYALRGVSRHQDWLGVGNAITPQMMHTDIELIRELGATTVRLAHYQHDQRFYDLCDETGLVVWAEAPQITHFEPAASANARAQLTELVVQNRHHASIVCWGLSNEITATGGSEACTAEHREQNALVHRLDPTRPTVMAHVFMLDIDDPLVQVPDVMSYNLYYGWYLGEPDDNDRFFERFRAQHPGVAIGLSEYGADANPAYQTSTPEKGDYTEQYQALYHEHMAELLATSPYIWASHVWNLADFGADGRDEGGNNGRNQKGLVTFDRSLRKDAFYVYKAAWSSEPFVHVAGRRYVDRAEDVTEVKVYSNCDEVSLWCDGELVAIRQGKRVFRFRVPLTGEHTIVARSGGLSDQITVRRVTEPNPAYRMPTVDVANWFAEGDLSFPDGFFSIRDSLADIKQTAAGRALVEQLMAEAMKSRGDVAQGIQMPPEMQRMLDQTSVEKLLAQVGDAIPPSQVIALNKALNAIAK